MKIDKNNIKKNHPEFISGSPSYLFNKENNLINNNREAGDPGCPQGGLDLITTSIPSPLEGEGARRAGEGEKMKKSSLSPLIRALPTFSLEGRRNRYCKAFTLIELLVVVLIIGILAAVAVPQYQKAVEKAKAAQALTLLKSVYQATKVYYIENNAFPSDFDQLPIEIPWTGNTKYLLSSNPPTRSNQDWSLQFCPYTENNKSIWVGRISGPYQGGGFMISLTPFLEKGPADEIICVEGSSNNSTLDFQKQKGDYCQKIFHASPLMNNHANLYYKL